jgi:hypothetical protein
MVARVGIREGIREGTCQAHVGFAAAAVGCPFREAWVDVRAGGMFGKHSEKRNC